MVIILKKSTRISSILLWHDRNLEYCFSADVGQKFFRIPSVASLPDPPTKPVVSEVTDTSVHLSWAPGTQIGASPVFAFQVDYFGFGTTEVSLYLQAAQGFATKRMLNQSSR